VGREGGSAGMASLAATLKSEIRRLAAREIRKALQPIRKIQKQLKVLRVAARAHRYALAGLKRRLTRMKAAARVMGGGRGGRGAQMSPEAIAGMRHGLGMSRLHFAKLLGVSPGSIFGWEKGRTLPRGQSLERLREVRKLGVRAARAQVKTSRPGTRRGRRGTARKPRGRS
jgi:putative transcriptional regulator